MELLSLIAAFSSGWLGSKWPFARARQVVILWATASVCFTNSVCRPTRNTLLVSVAAHCGTHYGYKVLVEEGTDRILGA
jgi:hypothetical protein